MLDGSKPRNSSSTTPPSRRACRCPSMSGSPAICPHSTFTSAPAVPHGRYSEGGALPNSTTCGQPTAAAACAGPESTVMSPRRARAAPANAESADRPRRCTAGRYSRTPRLPGSAIFGTVPSKTMACCGWRSRRKRSTCAQRSFGQYLLLAAQAAQTRRIVRLLPTCTRISGRSAKPRMCSHASRSSL